MIIYLYGQPASGKSTLAAELEFKLGEDRFIVIDGDNLRRITGNKDYSVSGRIENIKQAHTIAKFIYKTTGTGVIISMVSPFEALRRELQNSCIECFLIHLESSRTKGLDYICYDFEVGTPNLRLNTDQDIGGCVDAIIETIGVM